MTVAGDIVIQVEGLTKRFGDFVVVQDLDLTVRKGQIYGFLGPNGSGKTTTMRMLVGLMEPDSGRGECLGLDIRKDRERIRRRVGYMTQHFSLYGDLTVFENLAFVARVYGLNNPKELARRTVADLGLTGREDQLVAELSGGWKQRLSLAAATLSRPDLLLLDEPTAGVDPKARREFWDRIHALAEDGLTVLVSTHYMDEAERCHEIAYLAYGRLLAAGPQDTIVVQSGLQMREVAGPQRELAELSESLTGAEGVETVAPFGRRLRVGGTDKAALKRAVAAHTGDSRLTWRMVEPSLEDVFIHLLSTASDNRREAA